MMSSSDILTAARSIRAEVPSLLGQQGARVQAALDDLLAAASAGQDVDDQLWQLLVVYEPTRQRLNQLLPEVEEERGFEPFPGERDAIEADRFVCPRGDYEWPVFDSDDPVLERCPNHGLALQFVQAG
jgi:hypothetical protein